MSNPHVSLDEDLAAARFERWLDPDPLIPSDYDRAYAQGFEDAWTATRTPVRRDRLGLVAVAAAGLALLVAGVVIGRTLAAPRSGQTTERVDLSTLSSAALSGAPLRSPSADPPRPVQGGAPLITEPAALSGGLASWYDDGPGLYAAVPSWRFGDRPYRVRVVAGDRSVVVTVRDFCGCPGARIIDLSPAAFRELAPLSAGLVAVMVDDLRPGLTPPPTSTQP